MPSNYLQWFQNLSGRGKLGMPLKMFYVGQTDASGGSCNLFEARFSHRNKPTARLIVHSVQVNCTLFIVLPFC